MHRMLIFIYLYSFWIQGNTASIQGNAAKIPSNEKGNYDSTSGGVFQFAKDIGMVLISFMLGIDEEDYYNPTLIQGGAERNDEGTKLLNSILPEMVSI